jgi:transposase
MKNTTYLHLLKKCTYSNVYQYFINLSKNTTKTKKSCSGLIWRLHTTQDTLVRLEELKIEYVPKEENSPNVPEIRPIENFWANLKRKVYSNNYRPKNIKRLMAKIRKELKSLKLREFVRPAKARKAHRLFVTFFCK